MKKYPVMPEKSIRVKRVVHNHLDLTDVCGAQKELQVRQQLEGPSDQRDILSLIKYDLFGSTLAKGAKRTSVSSSSWTSLWRTGATFARKPCQKPLLSARSGLPEMTTAGISRLGTTSLLQQKP